MTNDEASDVYESDLELYEQMAMAWTWGYSSTPIVSYYPPVELNDPAVRLMLYII
jgi:hypothetical protein